MFLGSFCFVTALRCLLLQVPYQKAAMQAQDSDTQPVSERKNVIDWEKDDHHQFIQKHRQLNNSKQATIEYKLAMKNRKLAF